MTKREIEWPKDYLGRELETADKGWLEIVVLLPSVGLRHKVCFYDPTRLLQSIADDFNKQHYFAEAGVVVISKISTAEVVRTVEHLDSDFFFKLQPL